MNYGKHLIPIFILVVSISTPAQGLAANGCDSLEVRTVEAKIFPDKTDSPKFKFKFRYIRKNESANAITVVFIPGGPGQTSMGNDIPLNIPEDFNLMLTDPRTIGCNGDSDAIIPDAAIRTENIASDILTAIKSLGIKRYLVYGISYGTIVATMLQDLAQREGWGAEALVLEGVAGSSNAENWSRVGYNAQIKRHLSRLPLDVRTKVLSLTEDSDGLLNRGPEKWATFFTSEYMSMGSIAGIGSLLEMLLKTGLAAGASDSERQALLDAIDATNSPHPGAPPIRFYKAIACHEIWPRMLGPLTMDHGRVRPVANAENVCKDELFDRPYDPKKHLLKSRVIYLQGTDDPNTPVSLARANFKNQVSADRTLVLVQGAGHNPFVSAPQCMARIWSSLAKDPHGPLNGLDDCDLPVSITKISAGQK